MMGVETIGFVAGTLGILAWAPQIQKVWIDKKHEGVSLPTLYLVLLALGLWIVYGIMKSAPAVIWSNVAAALMILGVIFGVILQRKD